MASKIGEYGVANRAGIDPGPRTSVPARWVTAFAATFLATMLVFDIDPNVSWLPGQILIILGVYVSIGWMVYIVIRTARYNRVAQGLVWLGVLIVGGFGGAFLSSGSDESDNHPFMIASLAVNASLFVAVLLCTRGLENRTLRRWMLWAFGIGLTIALLYLLASTIDYGYGD